jgi:hypothetical protein
VNRRERRAAAARERAASQPAPEWLARHRAILAQVAEPMAEAFAEFAKVHAATGVVLVVACGGDPLAESLVVGAGEALEPGAVALVPMTREQAIDVLEPSVAPEVARAIRELRDDGQPVAIVIEGGRSSSWGVTDRA